MKDKINIVLLAVIVCLLAFIGYQSFYKSSKIAYIDSAKLLEKSKAVQAVQESLKADQEKVKANLDTLMQEFDVSMKSYEKNLATMTAKEKSMAQELLKTKQGQLMQYQQAVKQKANNEEQAKMQVALKEVNTFISEYGKSHGYDIIFATSNGNIAYGNDAIDITDEIIEGVNK